MGLIRTGDSAVHKGAGGRLAKKNADWGQADKPQPQSADIQAQIAPRIRRGQASKLKPSISSNLPPLRAYRSIKKQHRATFLVLFVPRWKEAPGVEPTPDR